MSIYAHVTGPMSRGKEVGYILVEGMYTIPNGKGIFHGYVGEFPRGEKKCQGDTDPFFSFI